MKVVVSDGRFYTEEKGVENMYSIGQIAKKTGLTVRALPRETLSFHASSLLFVIPTFK